MSIKQRLNKLEGPRGEPTIIYVVDSFGEDGEGYVGHAWHSKRRLIKRESDETEEGFKRRVEASS